MPRYKIVINVDGSRIDAVKKACLSAFGKDISAQVAKIETQPSRADRLTAAADLVEEAKNIVEELKGEMEEWKDNMPESLQGGDKAADIDECVSALEELEHNMDDIQFDDVSFPSMM